MKAKIKTQKLVLGSFLALIVISSFIYMPVIADSHDEDEDNDGIDDSYEEENSREVEIEYSPTEVNIESSLETNGDIENEFDITVKTSSDGLYVELEFEEEFEDNETEIEFGIRITEIVEFRDLVADGMYNSSNDETVKILKLDSFNPIQYTVETINNETVHVLFMETVDEVFTATLYATGEFANINGVVVTPTQVKFDVGIHNFNYTEIDSMLALKVKLESEVEVDYEEDDETEDEVEGRADNEYEVEVNLGIYEAFFSWIETAIIDGVEQEVKATPLDIDEEETKVYLNYPRGNEIIHDPKVGMADLLSRTGITNMIFIAAVALLTIPGLALLFRKRNKK
ncbi:MAG: hypothetical protein KAU62_12590 [Candidatus Heimdallarchaeota archaeon]|jgi:hypothetical protein|nr:hypothetical protein [Candidatus Heimdallarchaeota archaeon]MCG3256925.1 hypothetical protein [Candidatus Heimdallarchaeota archaeon]MCK4611988.1 hypothetical protein [Candidatus Heimdallarchaeota archaeon]